jgi:hypothetical protein
MWDGGRTFSLCLGFTGQHIRESIVHHTCVTFFFQVILSYVNISQEHYQRIKEKGKVDSNTKATISYTRPYDFLNVDDRLDIMEALFWFGIVQSKYIV